MRTSSNFAFVAALSAIAVFSAASHSLAGTPESSATKPQERTALDAALSTIADSVHVRFQGLKDLNGTYRLNEDETVSIPGVGRLSISGMTAADLEQALAKRIMGSTGRLDPVSVEVDTYRHVFVDGIVAKPGSFQWQRGLTVIKALSMSGGLYRPNAAGPLASSPIAQRGKLDITRLELARALVRQARLEAELSGQKVIDLPERLIGIFGRRRGDQLLETEQTILDNRLATVASRLKSLDEQRDSVSSEIGRLDVLLENMTSRTKDYRDLIKTLRDSHQRGSVSNQRLFEVESRLGELEEKVANTQVQLVRAQSELRLNEAKRAELTVERREKLIVESIKTKTDIGTQQIEYEMALDVIRSASGMSSAGADDADETSTLSFEIIRRGPQIEDRRTADRLDLLLPGDTLVVSRKEAPSGATQELSKREREGNGRSAVPPKSPGNDGLGKTGDDTQRRSDAGSPVTGRLWRSALRDALSNSRER